MSDALFENRIRRYWNNGKLSCRAKACLFGPKSRHLSINATDHEFNRIISVRHFEPFSLFNGVYALTLLQYETCHEKNSTVEYSLAGQSSEVIPLDRRGKEIDDFSVVPS